MAATPSLFPAADGPLPSRRADAAADRNSSAAPGTRRAARPVASDPEASYSQIPLDGHTKSRRRHRSVTRGDDPKPGTCAPDAPDTTSSPGQMKTRHLLRHIQRALARVIGELTSSGSGTPARSRLMRSGSPAAGTDHVWAAAAHISPLCKVAGP